MPKYEAARCDKFREPPDDKWCVFFDGAIAQSNLTEEQAKTEAERLQKSWEDMVSYVLEKQAKVPDTADGNGPYLGRLHRADEYHLLQCLGQNRFVIHRRAALTTPLLLDIKYRDGHGSVALDVGPELGRGRT